MVTILKTLVQKTALVRSVKLGSPADRLGLGFVVATYPAEVLSSGHFSMPPRLDSKSNPGGHRQELSVSSMREHRAAMATSMPPAGSVGRDVPGTPACRWPASAMQRCIQPAQPSSRVSFPATSRVCERIGDCQSSDRRDDRRVATIRETTSTATAAI